MGFLAWRWAARGTCHALRRPERKLIPAGDRPRRPGSRDRRSAAGARAALRMPIRRETATRRGGGPARSVSGAFASNRCRPDRRVSISSARQSRPGPRSARGARPLPGSGSAARISTHPGVPGSVHRQVEAVVHAVDEVDVEGSRGAEERRGARRPSAIDVRGRVALAQVGFGFDDARLERSASQPPHQHAADQAARGLGGRERQQRAEPRTLLPGRHRRSIGASAKSGRGGASGRLVVQRATRAAPHDPHRDRADHEPREGHDRDTSATGTAPCKRAATRPPRSVRGPLRPARNRSRLSRHHAATSADATGRSWRRDKHRGRPAPSSASSLRDRNDNIMGPTGCQALPVVVSRTRNPFQGRAPYTRAGSELGRLLGLAGRQGFEPRFHGPEPCVLPLDDLPSGEHRS